MKADTGRGEVFEILKNATAPMTNPEIFAQCKLVEDRKALADILFQFSKTGHAKRAGEQEQAKGKALALFVIGDGVAPVAGSGKAERAAERAAKSAVKKAPKAKSPAPHFVGATQKVKATAKPRGNFLQLAMQPLDAQGFRCGVFNDGTVAIHCAEGLITLQKAEVRALVTFVCQAVGDWD